MNYDVVVETAQAELVAAVRATVPISDIAPVHGSRRSIKCGRF